VLCRPDPDGWSGAVGSPPVDPPARTALFLPLFGELAEPGLVADLGAEAEAAGWDGLFVWDHMLYRAPVTDVADPWITLAAVACATERLVIGPMVTPVSRRRPGKLARETVGVDRLSRGRLVFGAGLGGDPGRELSALGEELDPVARGRLLDEGLDLLVRMWSGEQVDHRGAAHLADGVAFLPRPMQRPRIPVWLASRYPNRAPLRRAARYDGLFPIGMEEPDHLRELLDVVAGHRAEAGISGPFAAAVQGTVDEDPGPWVAAGATWWLVRFDPFTVTAAEIRDAIARRPPTGPVGSA
jgi:alkanesulfonate monooxygenase SsuD/methylene tetrahydromethanopterin reductase-like flavin-dependent oxidoreductase (luciferase family)